MIPKIGQKKRQRIQCSYEKSLSRRLTNFTVSQFDGSGMRSNNLTMLVSTACHHECCHRNLFSPSISDVDVRKYIYIIRMDFVFTNYVKGGSFCDSFKWTEHKSRKSGQHFIAILSNTTNNNGHNCWLSRNVSKFVSQNHLMK